MQNLTRGALTLAIQITGCEDEAMDILQAATVKTLEGRRGPSPDDQGYRAWFYRVVRNLAIDWLRSQKKFDRHAQPALSDDNADPEKIYSKDERKLLLHKALGTLTTEQREIICLKDFHDFSYAEIADILGIEKGTVMSRLHRARLALRDKLIELKVFSGDEDEL